MSYEWKVPNYPLIYVHFVTGLNDYAPLGISSYCRLLISLNGYRALARSLLPLDSFTLSKNLLNNFVFSSFNAPYLLAGTYLSDSALSACLRNIFSCWTALKSLNYFLYSVSSLGVGLRAMAGESKFSLLLWDVDYLLLQSRCAVSLWCVAVSERPKQGFIYGSCIVKFLHKASQHNFVRLLACWNVLLVSFPCC